MNAAPAGAPPAHDEPAALLPRTAIARSFGAAAQRYDAHALLQRQVATHLLTLLPLHGDPQLMLDLGCGTGYCAEALQQRWPRATLVALDIAEPMLQATARRVPSAGLVCADAEALPLAGAALDLVVSSLAIQWCRDYARLFRELRRVTRPGATVLLSTFGPASLQEVRAAWATVDAWTHVNQFADADTLARHAVHAGFRCRVQRELRVEEVASLQAISRNLKQIGAHNMNRTQARGLTSPRLFRQAAERFAAGATAPGRIPLSWELYYFILERSHEADTP
ncbi:MAG: malonyl-ACP O-methyltransferase BioC [Pseudohongiellaceae bacterium]